MSGKTSSKSKGKSSMKTRPVRPRAKAIKTSVPDEALERRMPSSFQKPVHLGWKVVSGALLVAVFFGLLAGFGGAMAGLVFKSIPIPFVGRLDLEQYLPKKEITIKTQEKVTVTPDIRIDEVAEEVKSQIVNIYPEKSASSAKESILEQVYRPEEALGQGFVLTSDGWIATTVDVAGGQGRDNHVVITADNSVFPVKRALYDGFSGVSFLKVEATGLSAAKLASVEYLTLGQQVLAFGSPDSLSSGHISMLGYRPGKTEESIVASSEEIFEFLKADCGMGFNAKGSPIVNLRGEVVGIWSSSGDMAIQVNHLKGAIRQVFKEGEIERPYLGIKYIDLSRSPGILDKELSGMKRGALVYGAPDEGSPAWQADIRNRDIITKVNSDSVNSWYSLTELVQEYGPGEEIELTIIRSGEEMTVRARLEKHEARQE